MSEYTEALNIWRTNGGPRPALRPDGVPTRIDVQWYSHVELSIANAMQDVENAGGSRALTDAVRLLSQAKDRVADHIEGNGESFVDTLASVKQRLADEIESFKLTRAVLEETMASLAKSKDQVIGLRTENELLRERADTADHALVAECAGHLNTREDAHGLASELAQAAIELGKMRDALEASQASHRRDRKLLAAAYGRSTEGRFG